MGELRHSRKNDNGEVRGRGAHHLCRASNPKDLDANPAIRVCRRSWPEASTLGIALRRSRIQIKPMRKNRFSAASLLVALLFPIASRAQQQAPGQPQTPAPTSSAAARENYDPLLDLPPLPHTTITLIGGTVVRLDEIMNRMVVEPFGGKQKMKVAFDSRTHFYENGKPITEREIKQGQRIYLDTQLNGSRVFAKTIWIQTSTESGLGQGQILDFDPAKQILTVRDELSSQPIKMHLSSATVIRRGEQTAAVRDLVPGTLVSLSFGPRHEVQRITVLATPGTSFTFAGRVTYLDMSRKMIAIDNRSDRKKYDVYVSAIPLNILRQVREGENVNVSAVFDGNQYDARSVTVVAGRSSQPQ
jgi:hypothetical protein